MGIKEDFRLAPHLFQIKKVKLDKFIEKIPLAPDDLIEFWTELGTGEIFETETIYSPSNDEHDDNVLDINEYFIGKGMSPSHTVFHTGVAISAYRTEPPRYVILDESTFEVIEYFETIEEWYCNTLRKEYAERYGLTNKEHCNPKKNNDFEV
jgi:hypothetical protein